MSNLNSDFTSVELDYEVRFRRLRHIHQRRPSSEQSPIVAMKSITAYISRRRFTSNCFAFIFKDILSCGLNDPAQPPGRPE